MQKEQHQVNDSQSFRLFTKHISHSLLLEIVGPYLHCIKLSLTARHSYSHTEHDESQAKGVWLKGHTGIFVLSRITRFLIFPFQILVV